MPVPFCLSEQIERLHWASQAGVPVWTWLAPGGLALASLARLLYHDVAVPTEYVINLSTGRPVAAGWWQALQPLLEQQIDYIGAPEWWVYAPQLLAALPAHPWYMGVPWARRDGQAGVPFLGGAVVAVRAERLREANHPDFGPAWRAEPALYRHDRDILLGEVARQLGWTQGTLNSSTGIGL
jgi:hypothetical protein